MELTNRPFQSVHGKRKYFPRILGVYLDNSACSYYRIVLPMKLMAQCGYPVGWGEVRELVKLDMDLTHYDAVLISRLGARDLDAVASLFDHVHSQGKATLIDYDDNFLNVPLWNPFYPGEGFVDRFKEVLKQADGVIVTNEQLLQAYKPYTKRLAVIPNYVDTRMWPGKTPRLTQSGKLTIGLTGSPSHVRDWEIVEKPLRTIMSRYGDKVDLLVGGFCPPYLMDVATQIIPWTRLDDYPRLINSIDIGLCPLLNDEFNHCKTPIKAYELGMAGAAVIASPTVYDKVVRGKGIIAETEQEWETALERFINNPYELNRAGIRLKQHVRDRYDIARHGEQIANAYKEIYDRVISGGQAVSTA